MKIQRLVHVDLVSPTDVVVDVAEVAAKIMRDPAGLGGVSNVDLLALAQYALLPASETVPSVTTDVAVAIAKVMRAWTDKSGQDLEDALGNLKTTFEKEFPDASSK